MGSLVRTEIVPLGRTVPSERVTSSCAKRLIPAVEIVLDEFSVVCVRVGGGEKACLYCAASAVDSLLTRYP